MTPKESCEKEITRFFNKYYGFCASSDSDDLKEVLSSLCSSFEKLEKATKEKFKNNKRYIALKALRNFATHESELLNESKALDIHAPTIVQTEVNILCLLPKSAIKYVLNDLDSDFTKKCIRDNVIFYNKFVDIYPSIFNAAVDLYFLVEKHLLKVDGNGFSNIFQAIKYEKENNYSHYIDGKIIMLDGSDINNFIETSVISIDKKNSLQTSLPVDRDGLYNVVSLYSTSPFEQVKLMKDKDKKYILDLLLSTKAIKIEPNTSSNYVAYMNRSLTPIEVVIAHQYTESLNE
jgi:hypothetical protein